MGGPLNEPTRPPLDQVTALNYVTVPEAPAYRAIIDVFATAKQRYRVQLRPDDVADALVEGRYAVELSPEQLHTRLDALCEWGNLSASHDVAAVDRLDDFYRRRLIYRLSPAGEAAHEAVAMVEGALESKGSLQTTMLAKVQDAIRLLAGLLEHPEAVDPDVAKGALDSLHAAFQSLSNEASRFIGELQRFLQQDALDVELFELRKRALISYLQGFVERLVRLSDPIRRGVAAISAADLDGLLDVAARSSDLPPAMDGASPAEVFKREQRLKWRGVVLWFAPASGDSTERELHRIALQSVSQLVHSLHRLRDRVANRVDRAADFRQLARWFADCPDDAAAHRLYLQAFGLHGARHFHLVEEDAELTSAQASWWDATPVAVPVHLRARGAAPTIGRSGKLQDLAGRQDWLRELRRQARAARRDALLALVAALPDRRLSTITPLSAPAFALFQELLDVALAAPRDRDGRRVGDSEHGDCRVRLQPVPGSDPVTLSTELGRFTLPWDAHFAVELTA